MGTMNVSQLNYVAVMCESAIYGAFSLLILVVVWILLTTRKMARIHMAMFGASILMWILSTVHLGFLIQRLTFTKPTLWEAKGAVALAALQVLIGELILIWRVYAVWGRKYWPIIIPVILMISEDAVRFSVVADGSKVLHFVADPANFISIANTVYCTALIAGRIWYIRWKIGKVTDIAPTTKGRRNPYEGALLMIIESGALYTLSLIVSVIVDKVHSPGIHVILDINMPLVGIFPTLIILIVHFKLVPGTRGSISKSTQLSTMEEFRAVASPRAIVDLSSRDEAGTNKDISTVREESREEDIGEKYNRSIV